MAHTDKLAALLSLYKAGRFIKLIEKDKNRDYMLRAMVLLALAEEPRTIQELVDYLGVGYSTVSEMVTLLQREELVVKDRGDDDFRFRVVALTAKGLVHVKLVQKSLRPYGSTIFRQFSAGEISHLRALLEKLNF